jgi:trehalose 6-phosphate synthase/phosphatase
MAFEQGTPDHIPPDQPDPAMVGTSLSTLGEGAYKKSATVTPPLEQASESDQTSSGQSYFSEIPGANLGYAIKSPSSLEEAASGVRSGTELLRRLSLVSSPVQASPALDRQVAHPGLELTGRLISAAFCIPYKVEFSPGNEWVCSFVHLC